MLDYISGKIVGIHPTKAIIERNGIGYLLHISFNTFEAMKDQKEGALYTYLHVKNEGQNVSGLMLYGFATKEERAYFEVAISVSGIGTSTARLMLSAMTPDEIATAIALEDVEQITRIKGIGEKTAKRLILELKDKIGKIEPDDSQAKQITRESNTIAKEALTALTMLGINTKTAQKVIRELQHTGNANTVEDLVKESLKKL